MLILSPLFTCCCPPITIVNKETSLPIIVIVFVHTSPWTFMKKNSIKFWKTCLTMLSCTKQEHWTPKSKHTIMLYTWYLKHATTLSNYIIKYSITYSLVWFLCILYNNFVWFLELETIILSTSIDDGNQQKLFVVQKGRKKGKNHMVDSCDVQWFE